MKRVSILALLLLTGCAGPHSLPPLARNEFNFYFCGWHRQTTAAEDAEALRLWSAYVASNAAWDEADTRETCDAMIADEMKVWGFLERTFR